MSRIGTAATERPGEHVDPQESTLPIIDLTDEELAAIDTRTEDTQLVVYPYLDQMSPTKRNEAIVTAFRGLAAREYVTGPDAQQLQAALASGERRPTVDIGMNEALSGLLELRRAPTVVCMQRTRGERQDFCYYYRVDDDAVLEEFIEPLGLHRFRLVEAGLLPGLLIDYLNPGGLLGYDGQPETVDASVAAAGGAPSELVDRLGAATSFGEFFVRHLEVAGERPPMFGVFAGDDVVYATESHFDSGDPVVVTPVSAGTLRRRVEGLLA